MIRKNQDGSSDEVGKNKISVRDLRIIQVLLEPRGSTIISCSIEKRIHKSGHNIRVNKKVFFL
jgi:hypothetical protein